MNLKISQFSLPCPYNTAKKPNSKYDLSTICFPIYRLYECCTFMLDVIPAAYFKQHREVYNETREIQLWLVNESSVVTKDLRRT